MAWVTDKDGDRVGLGDLLGQYMTENRMHHFEGDSGLEKLEKLFTALGYAGHGFRWGSPIEAFLADNPGAIEAILTWVEDQDSDEWCVNIDCCLNAKDDDEEDEDDTAGDE